MALVHMIDKGGLPSIPAYNIARSHYLHELTWLRAHMRVHGTVRPGTEKRHLQKELCKIRKEHYK